MAVKEALVLVSGEASGDLSGSQYCGVVIDTNGRVALAGVGSNCAGVLYDKPAALGRACAYGISGKSPLRAGGNITKGTKVAPDSNGAFVAIGSGDRGFATALEAASAGQIFTALIDPAG